MNQKGFANLVLIGIVVLLVAIGGYFVWKRNQKTVIPSANPISTTTTPTTFATSTDKITGWQIYQGSTVYGVQYRYSIEYPSTWKLIEDPLGRDPYYLEFSNCTIGIGAGAGGSDDFNVISTENFQVGSLVGLRTVYMDKNPDVQNTNFVITHFINGNYLFELIYPQKDTQCLTDYNSILQTLKIK